VRVTWVHSPALCTCHRYFDRDVECVRRWFERRYGFIGSEVPQFGCVEMERETDLDAQVAASGCWSREQEAELSNVSVLMWPCARARACVVDVLTAQRLYCSCARSSWRVVRAMIKTVKMTTSAATTTTTTTLPRIRTVVTMWTPAHNALC